MMLLLMNFVADVASRCLAVMPRNDQRLTKAVEMFGNNIQSQHKMEFIAKGNNKHFVA